MISKSNPTSLPASSLAFLVYTVVPVGIWNTKPRGISALDHSIWHGLDRVISFGTICGVIGSPSLPSIGNPRIHCLDFVPWTSQISLEYLSSSPVVSCADGAEPQCTKMVGRSSCNGNHLFF